MFQILIKVAMTYALATSALSKPLGTPTSVTGIQPFENGTFPAAPADLNGKITYRQASRGSILSRAEAKRAGAKNHALERRQSATVYPTCSTGTVNAIPRSGFVNFPGYSIDTNSANLIDGYFLETSPEISCVMYCNLTPGCTAGYWAGGNTCYLRKGTVAGTAMVPRPGTDRVAFLKGDCASLEPQINNATIMSACCNNPAPATVNRCTQGSYQNFGPYCLQTRNQYTAANRLTTVNVAGGTNLDLVYKNCAAYCTQYTANARTGNHLGCLVATYSYNNGGANNCAIYGGRLDQMSSSDSDNTNAAIAGTCEQFGATTISQRPARGGCYSNQSGP